MAVHKNSSDERIAVLEANLNQIMQEQHEEKERLEEVQKCLDSIKMELTRYKGFIGGVMFLLSAVFTFIKALPLINSLFNK
jgi:chromosome segregation ATPase